MKTLLSLLNLIKVIITIAAIKLLLLCRKVITTSLKVIKKLLRVTAIAAIILVSVQIANRSYKHYIYDFKGSSVVMLTGKFIDQKSGGTGFQVTAPSGKQYTMTNYHVCMLADDNKIIKAETVNGATHKLRVLYYSLMHDLCLLEPIKSLRSLSVANSMYKHEEVHIVGHPRLESLTKESGSIVSMKTIRIMIPTLKHHTCKNGREINPFIFQNERTRRFQEKYKYCGEILKAMHTNAISYGGNSGSPVLDDLGNVIGVLFAGTRGIPTSSLVVPLEYIQSFLENK